MVNKSRNVVKKTTPRKRELRVFSRHPSHDAIRGTIFLPFLACFRLGSTTEGSLPYAVEINTPEAIKNSSSKLLMKQCFDEHKVKTAIWCRATDSFTTSEEGITVAKTNVVLKFPIVAKSHYGSRGTGNHLLKTLSEFNTWRENKNLSSYLFEQYYNYVREYRIHIDEEDYFYACRKMLKTEAPKEERWHRHDSNCVWIMENNEQFDKPSNWDEIVKQSINALNAVGLNVGAVDVRVQSSSVKGEKRKEIDFIIVEINSAPSFGSVTAQKYLERIPIIAERLWKKK